MKPTFFGSAKEDEELEQVNQIFWQSLLQHLHRDTRRENVQALLDIGCHRGGLLELLAKAFRPRRLFGLEPLEQARHKAHFRLKGAAHEVRILDPARWDEVPGGELDLVTCHEVLHLVADLPEWMEQVQRVLRPGAAAYVVLGCHRENPLWETWKPQLEAEGNQVFDHLPEEILTAAAAGGLETAVRPLRRDGWVLYDPSVARYRYGSMTEMFDHHYRHKLLFRFTRPGY